MDKMRTIKPKMALCIRIEMVQESNHNKDKENNLEMDPAEGSSIVTEKVAAEAEVRDSLFTFSHDSGILIKIYTYDIYSIILIKVKSYL